MNFAAAAQLESGKLTGQRIPCGCGLSAGAGMSVMGALWRGHASAADFLSRITRHFHSARGSLAYVRGFAFGDFQCSGMTAQRVFAGCVTLTGAAMPPAQDHRFPKQGRSVG
jgi:hypothetical protein